MGDIYFGLLVLAVLTTALFGVGRAIGRRVSSHAANWLSVMVIVFLATYLACLWNHTALVRLLPFSNLIVIGNWFPLVAGLLGGLASAQSSLSVLRRGLTVVVLQLAGAFVT